MERIKLSSMVLGKDKYNQVMFAIRDQSSQMMSHLNQLPNDLLNEYYAPLPASICTEVKRTADLMIFDALDYGMKWREAVNEPVKLSDWKVYPEFAQALGNVEYDSNGYVVRDPQGNVIFLPEQ
ncbi:hypothetical protein C9I98_02175 [Photobacterium sanctipauli]|uniref:Uncharacterized protein n=3 Tax=Photobacterium sanctipauli TaxID=1342794 RepID=A0A2T3P0P2_9GAMM|nr:hypothetical protein C9I98_02175 [Photobacterium sanctipauli]